jgi:flagellar protein FliS
MDARARKRYVDDSIATASPAKLVCLLYDRLLVDVRLGATALADDDRVDGSRYLAHAQEIVLELRAALDVSAWEGGPGLAALYDWLLAELGGAMVTGDSVRAAACEAIVAPLREAWHQAAGAMRAAA